MTDQTREPDETMSPPSGAVEIALRQSSFSPCRSKRGVVVFKSAPRQVVIYGRGHNHKPRGFTCDGSARCKSTCRVEAVHAEQMALINAGRDAERCDLLHVKSVNGALVPSGGPSCVQCSKLALQAGVAGVWLYHEDGWRRHETTEFHRLSLAAAPTPEPERATPTREIACLECGKPMQYGPVSLTDGAITVEMNGYACECGYRTVRGRDMGEFSLRRDLATLKAKLQQLEAANAALTEERDDLRERLRVLRAEAPPAVRALDAAALWDDPKEVRVLADMLERHGAICEGQYLRTIAHRMERAEAAEAERDRLRAEVREAFEAGFWAGLATDVPRSVSGYRLINTAEAFAAYQSQRTTKVPQKRPAGGPSGPRRRA